MKYLVPSLVVSGVFLMVLFALYFPRAGSKNSAASVTGAPTAVIEPTLTAAPTDFPGEKVEAGGVLSFPKYELYLPEGWEYSLESITPQDQKLVLKKGSNSLTIMEGAFGGGICLYQNEEGMEVENTIYDGYKELTTSSGDNFRRSWSGDESSSKGFTVCQKNQFGWQTPTAYGHISVAAAVNSSTLVLTEVDSILSSIRKTE